MVTLYNAILPSNQHQWRIVLPDGTVFKVYDEETKTWLGGEEAIQEPAADEMVREFARQSAATGNKYVAKEFFIPGMGDKSTDELGQMLDQSVAWLGQFPYAERGSISNHSNSGSSLKIPIYPQLIRVEEAPWAERMCKRLATTVGGYYQGYLVRSLMYMDHMRDVCPPKRAILHETGQHAGSVSAAYLARFQRYNAIQIVRNYLYGCNLPFDDGPVPTDVIVPPGTVFDKYRPGAVTPPTPLPPTISLPDLRIADPLMRDSKTGDFQTTYLITQYPIHWLQKALKTHVYKNGYYFTVGGVRYDIRALKCDGIYGQITAGAVKHFEAEHFWVNGKPMFVDGAVTAPDWEKLRIVG